MRSDEFWTRIFRAVELVELIEYRYLRCGGVRSDFFRSAFDFCLLESVAGRGRRRRLRLSYSFEFRYSILGRLS